MANEAPTICMSCGGHPLAAMKARTATAAALDELRFWLDYVSRSGGYIEQWVIDRLNHNRALIAEMEGQR